MALPPLALEGWRDTRDALHEYTKVVGAIRRTMAPPEPHWWHISLRPMTNGLTTGPMPIGGGRTVEMALDFTRHALAVDTSDGRARAVPLDGRPAVELADAALDILAELGASPALDRDKLNDVAWAYDTSGVTAWWSALRRISGVLVSLRSGLPGRASPVQLWPHHFDLSLNWFSGRHVPGFDRSDEENAEEQMGFGFSTGDEGIPEPYFYITAYPWPEALPTIPLPAPGGWHLEGWKGGLLRYAALAGAEHPEATLLGFLQAGHAAGLGLMAG